MVNFMKHDENLCDSRRPCKTHTIHDAWMMKTVNDFKILWKTLKTLKINIYNLKRRPLRDKDSIRVNFISSYWGSFDSISNL